MHLSCHATEHECMSEVKILGPACGPTANLQEAEPGRGWRLRGDLSFYLRMIKDVIKGKKGGREKVKIAFITVYI